LTFLDTYMERCVKPAGLSSDWRIVPIGSPLYGRQTITP
jgi:hypothetical protein